MIASISAEPVLVVFDDDTASGDPSFVDRVFRKRALNQRVWQLVENAFTGAIARSGDAKAALRLTETELEGVEDPAVRNTAAYREIRRTLTHSLSRRSSETPATVLDTLLKDARSRRQLAETRARRQY
jgi:hypothetical protein